MKYDRMPINKNMLPYNFRILLGDELFNLAVSYNESHDFFTIALIKDDILICSGEPIMYGVPLFHDIYKVGKYPALDIIPFDESGENDRVTFENLNETVFLQVDNAAIPMGGDVIGTE